MDAKRLKNSARRPTTVAHSDAYGSVAWPRACPLDARHQAKSRIPFGQSLQRTHPRGGVRPTSPGLLHQCSTGTSSAPTTTRLQKRKAWLQKGVRPTPECGSRVGRRDLCHLPHLWLGDERRQARALYRRVHRARSKGLGARWTEGRRAGLGWAQLNGDHPQARIVTTHEKLLSNLGSPSVPPHFKNLVLVR